jgi:hypothetical protein
MKYVFEKGPYVVGHDNTIYRGWDQEFSCDLDAIHKALEIGADYVWKTDGETNPHEVWRRK